MADPRLNSWKTLLARALELIDSVGAAGVRLEDWIGGLEVLDYKRSYDECIEIVTNELYKL